MKIKKELWMTIDPGTTESGFVIWKKGAGSEIIFGNLAPLSFGKVVNVEILRLLEVCHVKTAIIEQIKSYGNIIGDTTLRTVAWTGAMAHQAVREGAMVVTVPRKTVVTELCGN
jgi:hypothetical protein